MSLEQAWRRGTNPAEIIARFNAVEDERKRYGLDRHRLIMRDGGVSDHEIAQFAAWITENGAEIPGDEPRLVTAD